MKKNLKPKRHFCPDADCAIAGSRKTSGYVSSSSLAKHARSFHNCTIGELRKKMNQPDVSTKKKTCHSCSFI